MSISMEFDSKLLPVLRNGIDLIKMIFFKKLRERLALEYAGDTATDAGKLTGAIVNELFGVPSEKEPFASFAKEHRKLIKKGLDDIATKFEDMRIPLTDALRMQALCDHQEGIDSTATLTRAKELGILLVDRDMPLPHNFLHLARTLGSAFGLITPPRADNAPPL